jgi:PhoH-like ATPase
VTAPPARRTYVLDTSVLLSDPRALFRFEEHEVVVPVVALAELESKRHHPELGWAARETLRALEDLRVAHGDLTAPIPATDKGGTVRVELNHADAAGLSPALRGDSNDHRILAVARNLAADRPVVLVTKDLPLRLRASLAGVDAQEYRSELSSTQPWNGMVSVPVDSRG